MTRPFDRAAETAERFSSKNVDLLRAARLFSFEPRDSIVDHQGVSAWEPDAQLVENFRLPFDTVAIEEARGACCTFQTMGRPADRRFYYFVHLDNDEEGEAFAAYGQLTAFPSGNLTEDKRIGALAYMKAASIRDGRVVRRGQLDAPALSEFYVELMLNDVHIQAARRESEALKAEEVRANPGPDLKQRIQAHLKTLSNATFQGRAAVAALNVQIALLRVCEINDPAKFIVECEDVSATSAPRPVGAIARAAWRPHYILLDKKEIRRTLIPAPQLEVGARAPHERRGHFRRIPNDPVRFPNRHGKVTWVRPCWIGPREAIKGPNRYLVLVDV